MNVWADYCRGLLAVAVVALTLTATTATLCAVPSATAASVASFASTEGRVWHVPADAPTIQAGLDSAQVGDVVEVACGTYHEFNIVMKSGVTVRSEGGSFDCVTIDAQRQGRVFYCEAVDAAATVEGFTITGGSARDGAGMYCTVGTAMTIRRCRITANSADYAAGLACVIGSPLLIDHCVIDGNEAVFVGGGVACSGSSPQFVGCTFYGNRSSRGAAVWCQNNAAPLLQQCVLAFNTSRWWPFAVVGCENASANLVECDVYGNPDLNWVDCIAAQAGTNGNFSADPGFCDPAGGDFHVCGDSWCLPGALPGGHAHDQIGALDAGCPPCSPEIPTEHRSWGELKARFR